MHNNYKRKHSGISCFKKWGIFFIGFIHEKVMAGISFMDSLVFFFVKMSNRADVMDSLVHSICKTV